MKEKKEPARNLVLHPTPSSEQLMNFLDRVFHGDFEMPQKLTLCAVTGRMGQQMGPMIREFSFKPDERPTVEQRVELANLIVHIFQDDADALNKKCTYGVHAFHLGRSDRFYSRVLIRMAPSGMTTALQDERGIGADDEEGNAASSRLLMELLQSERRDKRYTLELALSAISGAMERDAERIERMEKIVDGAWAKQIEMMKATESMLSQAADRQARSTWEAFKREKVAMAIEKAIGITEMVVPQLLARRAERSAVEDAAAKVASASNPVGQFLLSVSEEQGARAFGAILGPDRVAGGVFSADQFTMLGRIASEAEPDNALVTAFVASLTAQQIQQAQSIFSMDQLMPLLSWLQSRKSSNGTVVQ